MQDRFDTGGVFRVLKRNLAAILFIGIAVFCYWISGMRFPYVLEQVLLRLAQNSFLALALIIPIVAGMGLNFSITVGAMTAQVAIFLVTHWAYRYGEFFQGFSGFSVAFLLTVPMALLLGYLTGKLLNRTKGQEMIAGMILGYFATGFYMFVFLIVVGGVIPVDNPYLIISGGTGVKNTYDIAFSGALDIFFSRRLGIAAPYISGLIILYVTGNINRKYFENKGPSALLGMLPFIVGGLLLSIYAVSTQRSSFALVACKYTAATIMATSLLLSSARLFRYGREDVPIGNLILLVVAAAIGLSIQILKNFPPSGREAQIFARTLLKVNVPMSTYLVIGALCVFNRFILNTKIGQDIRTVGQSMNVATASGIDVDKIRIYAIVLSTLFAGIGQLIYLQSLGAVQTYAAQNNVALYSVAALLVGGASVTQATNGQALFGILIFHTILIVLPGAVNALFHDAQNTEYFRAFMLYSVICISLISYAVSGASKLKMPAEMDPAETLGRVERDISTKQTQ